MLCPHLPPANGADAQRVRVMLPHLRELGWQAVVVAANDDSGRPGCEPELTRDMEAHAEVIRVDPWPIRIARRFGLRQASLRTWMPLRRLLSEQMDRRRFDAAFVSTTDFPLWTQTLRWPMPVVLDWQDPWLSDYYDRNPDVPKPGGSIRFAAMQAIARRYEPRVARHAAAHVVVTSAYRDALRDRYPDLSPDDFVVSPFGVARRDFDLAFASGQVASGERTWLYVGRGGPDMRFAARAFFEALAQARAREPARFSGLRVRFVGTAYDPRVTSREFERWASEAGVGDLVEEHPQRIGYLDMLRRLDAAEALVVPGSDDAQYNASKLGPYLATGKPILGIFRTESPAHEHRHAHAAVRLVSFDATKGSDALRTAISDAWFIPPMPAREVRISLGNLDAVQMSRTLVDVFDRAATKARSP